MFGAKKEKKKKREEDFVSLEEMIAAEEELKALKEQYGIVDEQEETKPKKEGWISKTVSAMFESQENRTPVAISKKTYLWLAVLTGWFGGHRFYAKHYKTGTFYLLFCWLGLGLYNTVLDILQVIPMKPDENGIIYL